MITADEVKSHAERYRASSGRDFHALQDLYASVHELASERDAAQAKCEEQARLLGISGSREANLLAEIDTLKASNSAWEAQCKAAEKEMWRMTEEANYLRADAERYRGFRKSMCINTSFEYLPKDVDAAFDAAILFHEWGE